MRGGSRQRLEVNHANERALYPKEVLDCSHPIHHHQRLTKSRALGGEGFGFPAFGNNRSILAYQGDRDHRPNRADWPRSLELRNRICSVGRVRPGSAGKAARAILWEAPEEWPGFQFDPTSRYVTMSRAEELVR